MTRSHAQLLNLSVGLGLLLAALAATPAWAKKTDRIHVADIVIVGEVKSLERGRLRISTDFMGTVEADWQQVTRVESSKWFEIEIKDGTRYFGNIIDSGEDLVLAVEGEETSARLPFSELVLINQSKEGFWGKIDLSLALGYSFVQATDTTQGSVTGDISRRTRRFHSKFYLLSILSETGDDRFTRNDVSWTSTRALKGRWTYDAAAEFQSNESLGLDQRYLLRASSLYRALRTDIRELALGAGLAAVREQYRGGEPGDNSLEGTLTLRYFAFHFDDPELEVKAFLTAYPSLTFSGRWRTEFQAEVSRELGWDLFWSLSLYWSTDNKPVSPGAQSSDLSITASLGWSP